MKNIYNDPNDTANRVYERDENLNMLVVEGTTVPSTTDDKQVDTITVTGTNWTANIKLAGWLTKLLTFVTGLTETNAAFVVANAAAYLVEWIVLTASTDTLIFTAETAWVGFTSPSIESVTLTLAWTVVNTTPNANIWVWYAKGCTFIDLDVVTWTGWVYLNKGTTTASEFTLAVQAA